MQAVLLLGLMSAAAAAPQLNRQPNIIRTQPEVRILDQKFDQDSEGNWEWSYEQDDGQRADQTGRVFPGPEPETGSITMVGSYEFVGLDGNTYRMTYEADEGGFKPAADYLPVAPAQIPEYALLRQEYPQLFWAENDANLNINPSRFFN